MDAFYIQQGILAKAKVSMKKKKETGSREIEARSHSERDFQSRHDDEEDARRLARFERAPSSDQAPSDQRRSHSFSREQAPRFQIPPQQSESSRQFQALPQSEYNMQFQPPMMSGYFPQNVSANSNAPNQAQSGFNASSGSNQMMSGLPIQPPVAQEDSPEDKGLSGLTVSFEKYQRRVQENKAMADNNRNLTRKVSALESQTVSKGQEFQIKIQQLENEIKSLQNSTSILGRKSMIEIFIL